ncbi:hypothetical protein NITGR_1050033 [Nitrospina gracilis 3/211]|uniref:Uncharacterized protein n=1 Tax=Nitrospina gracilis (strain 3/211) TaxID=1266370 RepID=M1Z8S5_NITG3|nr:hypothetical protein NITGR_1050033 [Nitrospina gracilis 3/211]
MSEDWFSETVLLRSYSLCITEPPAGSFGKVPFQLSIVSSLYGNRWSSWQDAKSEFLHLLWFGSGSIPALLRKLTLIFNRPSNPSKLFSGTRADMLAYLSVCQKRLPVSL